MAEACPPIDAAWLGQRLGERVLAVRLRGDAEAANWSSHQRLIAVLADGRELALRLKRCTAAEFDGSEIDYYLRDYRELANAPLPRCWHGERLPGAGYQLLLADLADTHEDRRDRPPSLAHGLALAEALALLHRHHWRSQPAPTVAQLQRYFAAIEPGLAVIEGRSGLQLAARYREHKAAMRARWADPAAMSLLHGDANPTNVLAPRGAEGPVLLIDRQPFAWSLRYGPAVWDLAYATVPWWPEAALHDWAEPMLRHWWQCLGAADYDWVAVQADWRLAIDQCLHVAIEWCAEPAAAASMQWLWSAQLQRVLAALES